MCSTSTLGCAAKEEKDRLIDMQCAGRNFHDKNARLGLNAKLHSLQGAEDKTNLQIVDIPAIEQTRGSFYGAELVEFSLGVSLLDVIEFEEDYYLSLSGMDSRIETVAWVRNTELGNAAAAKDVRSMGDLGKFTSTTPPFKFHTSNTPQFTTLQFTHKSQRRRLLSPCNPLTANET